VNQFFNFIFFDDVSMLLTTLLIVSILTNFKTEHLISTCTPLKGGRESLLSVLSHVTSRGDDKFGVTSTFDLAAGVNSQNAASEHANGHKVRSRVCIHLCVCVRCHMAGPSLNYI
jgi:hypothetical protein